MLNNAVSGRRKIDFWIKVLNVLPLTKGVYSKYNHALLHKILYNYLIQRRMVGLLLMSNDIQYGRSLSFDLVGYKKTARDVKSRPRFKNNFFNSISFLFYNTGNLWIQGTFFGKRTKDLHEQRFHFLLPALPIAPSMQLLYFTLPYVKEIKRLLDEMIRPEASRIIPPDPVLKDIKIFRFHGFQINLG